MSKSESYMQLYSRFWGLREESSLFRSQSTHLPLYCPENIDLDQLEDFSSENPDCIIRIDHDSFFHKDRKRLEKLAYFIFPEKLVMRCDITPETPKEYIKHFNIKSLQENEWQEEFSKFSKLHDPEKQLEALFKNEEQTQLLAAHNGIENIALAAAVRVEDKSFINSVIVAQDHRRQKAASRLMNTLLHSPFLPKTQQAWLEVYRENTAAVNLYLKCGFKIDHSFYLLKKNNLTSPLKVHSNPSSHDLH